MLFLGLLLKMSMVISEPKNPKPYFVPSKDDGDDPAWMDTMDYPRKKK